MDGFKKFAGKRLPDKFDGFNRNDILVSDFPAVPNGREIAGRLTKEITVQEVVFRKNDEVSLWYYKNGFSQFCKYKNGSRDINGILNLNKEETEFVFQHVKED
jgi:hypothetical protein